MNLDHAPKFFWAALSFSLVCLTGGLLVLAYRASSVSVEFADAKVSLANDKIAVSSIVNETKEQLQALQKQNQELERVKAELEGRIARLSSASNSAAIASNRVELTLATHTISNVSKALPPPQKIENDLKRLDMIQNSLMRPNPAMQRSF